MEIIKTILEENNINQSELCKELGISHALLSSILHHRRNISVNLANKLHKKYNIDYAILLSRSNANEK
tara:strand:- start:5 stop:208 length:204 start_codon:yes stop_codon:yes gene_type:complete